MITKTLFRMYLLFTVYGAGHNDFDAGKIHYKGHWKGGGS
jgi:hypothetical protein